jgi:hypothetical protein
VLSHQTLMRVLPRRSSILLQPPNAKHHAPPRSSRVVERTFAWLYQSRRLSTDYERLPETSETLIYVTMTRLMLRRLAPR